LGKPVLLLEGDTRRHTLGAYFDEAGHVGWPQFLTEETDFDATVEDSGIENLDLLPAGAATINSADLIASDRFGELISGLRKRYAYIVIDSPPVLVVPDARLLARWADLVLFTVQWEKTPKPQVQEAMRIFASSGQQIHGLILSQINARKMRGYDHLGRDGTSAGYGARYYAG
jgi:capsular exopolysaccharide synthesis family protein